MAFASTGRHMATEKTALRDLGVSEDALEAVGLSE